MPDETTTQRFENMTLYPHQEEFVRQVVDSSGPARYFLSSPPGAGKVAAIAAAAGALKANRSTLRCIAIVPAPLALMWQDQLMKFGGLEAVVMTPQSYRRLQAETGVHVNIWLTVTCVVASIDFLKSADRMDEVLAAKWDLAILDQVHNCSETSLRGDVARRIWSDQGVAIAVAVTETPNRPEWLAADAGTTKIHWTYGTLLRHGIVPERRLHVINYVPSDSERQIAAHIYELLGQAPNNQQTQFTVHLLLRRLASSMYAFEQSLRRLLTIETYRDFVLDESLPDQGKEEDDAETAGTTIHIDREAGERILGLLEEEAKDSKWECCFELLDSRGISNTCSGIIFTDFVATAQYLEYLTKSRFQNVFLITGASTMEERQRLVHEAQGLSSLLIVTTALEGLTLGFTNQVIHYDVPWDPAQMFQRYGRVERIGSRFETFDHYYLIESGNATNETFARLIEKLQVIESQWK